MNQPEITDEEIGMRAFQLRKSRAVEHAMERIRQGLGEEWSALSIKDIETLNWALGETWAHLARPAWNEIQFTGLGKERVDRIIQVAKRILAHEILGHDGLSQIDKILKD
ncbi:MAG: hypothetical protein C4521_06995 [Actinobacteria bacterium]|nr:MAG: hypothetical protein C4521_06995 [Actinomycetota bacterium]